MNEQVKQLTPKEYVMQSRHVEEFNECMNKLKTLVRFKEPEVHTAKWKTITSMMDKVGKPIFKSHEITVERQYPSWIYELEGNGTCRRALIKNKNWQTDLHYQFVDI